MYSSETQLLELAPDGSCAFVANCTESLLLLHPTDDNGSDIGRDLLPLFHDIEKYMNLDPRESEVTKMIAITTALLNQLTPVEDLGLVIEEMFSVGMFRYKKRTGHIHKVSNVLELLRKVDLISFEVQCPFCLYDCSCKETHFQYCGCHFPADDAVVNRIGFELNQCDQDNADNMEVDSLCDGADVMQDMVSPFLKPTGVPSRLPRISKNCDHKRVVHLKKKRSYSDTFLKITSSTHSESPAKRGRPHIGRPPDPGPTY